MTTGMLLRDDLLFDTDETTLEPDPFRSGEGGLTMLGITFGTGAAGDPELGFQVRKDGYTGHIVSAWMKAGRRHISRGLSRESARKLAARLRLMADALDAWFPEQVAP